MATNFSQCALFAILAFSLYTTQFARAQENWQAIIITPSGVSSSSIAAIDGDIQVGFESGNGLFAGFWENADPDSWTLLPIPIDAEFSRADAVDNGQIVGSVGLNDTSNAVLWDADGNFVNLHPPGAVRSQADAIFGDQQGGLVRVNESDNHAAVWSGSAASFIDLHPSQLPNSDSYVLGMYENIQVGYAQNPSAHACLWNSTAESWLDIHPSNQIFGSDAWATDGIQIVGRTIEFDGGVSLARPALWDVESTTFQSLLPSGYFAGEAFGVCDGRQVGAIRLSLANDFEATIWNGEANEFVNLDDLLEPGKYRRSFTRDIITDGAFWYVVGQAITFDFNSDAVIWMAPVVKGDLNRDGNVNLLDVSLFIDRLATGTFQIEADTNCDGVINLFDVAPFVEIIIGA